MQLSRSASFSLDTPSPLLILGAWEDKVLDGRLGEVDVKLGGAIADLQARGTFKAKKGQSVDLLTLGRLSARRVVVLGLGKEADATPEVLRQFAGRAARAAVAHKEPTFVLVIPASPVGPREAGQAVAEGAALATWHFSAYRTEQDEPPVEVTRIDVVAEQADATFESGISEGLLIADAVRFSRNLVQAPPNEVTPTVLADRAAAMAKHVGLACTVLDENQIADLKMGAFLGVAAGSRGAQPPRFIILEHRPEGVTGDPLVLVGKGITFDSGGISIKPADGMEKMKYDMAGGAAVIGAMQAIAALKLPVPVIGLVPATENMPSGSATHPGDVLTALNGKTIEIVNTDAEGRLILADALAYASRYKPRGVVDLATLTSACVVALGQQAIGLLGNDQAWIDRVRAAGERANERAWQLPLWKEYNDQIKSDIADMKNSGGRPAGTITAAAMLAKFAEDYKWAHLDIAGTAWEDKGRPYTPKGATGVGVRLLVELVRAHA
jgi:leucyl aminopeptidase